MAWISNWNKVQLTWPYDDEYGYYAVPDSWAGEYSIPHYSATDRANNQKIIQWLNDNIKNTESNVWYIYEYFYLRVAFRNQKDYTMFLLRWS